MCEQSRDDAGKNVARTALGEARVVCGYNENAPVGARDEGGRALEEDEFFCVVGDVSQQIRNVDVVCRKGAEKPFEFPAVRREDCIAGNAEQE